MPMWQRSEFYEKQDDPTNAFLGGVKSQYIPVAQPPLPDFYFTDEEQTVINEKYSSISVYVDQMEAKFISGQEPLSNWDTFVDNIKGMGIDDVQKVYDAAYERYKQVK